MSDDQVQRIELHAQLSPSFDAYAAGEIGAADIVCLMCRTAPCRCEEVGLTFGSAGYLARLRELHAKPPAGENRTP